jgi:hypothetical protein
MDRPNARLSIFAVAIVVDGLALMVVPTAQASNNEEILKLQPDALSYAKANNVSVQEAAYRLSVHAEAGELDAALAETYPDTYAGLWLQHQPDFRIIVQFTESAELPLAKAVLPPDLALLVDVIRVKYSLRELEDKLQSVAEPARNAGASVYVDVIGNRVQVQRTDEFDGLDSVSVADGITIDPQVYVAKPAEIALIAGFPISGCTNGFTAVVKYTSTYRMTTAGHCPDSQVYSGQNMPFILEKFQGSNDEQSHGIAQTIPTNEFIAGSPPAARTVTSRTFRVNQPINGWTCKYGNSTHETCGYLKSKTFQPGYVPNANATFMLVQPNGGPDMVNGGDSGGPVYLGHSAYGLVSGEYGLPWCMCDLIFTAANYVEDGLGVWILSYAP